MNMAVPTKPWGTGLVKICGVQRPDEALAAVSSGAQLVGVVFASRSRRRVTADQAKAIADAVAQRALLVGVFMDQPVQEILNTARAARIDVLQLHGGVRGDAPQLAAWPVILRMPPRDVRVADRAGRVMPLLDPGTGDGIAHDWRQLPVDARGAFVAGGLTPANVAEVIALTGALGVDVSSGVEGADGYKDTQAMATFCAAARQAFARLPPGAVVAA